MVFKWRDSHVPLFLEHFQKYECLWNTKSNSYKDRNQRDNAIRSLKEDLNIDGVTEEDIKLKIKSIRTRYTFELAKIKKSTKSGCSMDEVYVPKLFWFAQADTFLNAVCTTRESSSNLDIESNLEQEQQNNPLNVNINGTSPRAEVGGYSNNLEQQHNNEHSGPSQQISEVNNVKKTLPHATPGGHSAPSTSQAPRHFKRGKKRLNELPIDRAIKQLKEINDENNKEDEFDLFCRSLAIQLKAMPLQRALICQERLQSVMVQERLRSIVHSPTYSETMSSSQSRRSASEMSNYSELSYNIQSPTSAEKSRTNPQTSYGVQLISTNFQQSPSENSNNNETSYIVQSPPESVPEQTQQATYALQLPPTYPLPSEYEQAITAYENYHVFNNNQSQATDIAEQQSEDLLQIALRSITD